MTPHALVARPPSAALVPAGQARPEDAAEEIVQHRSFVESVRRRWRTVLVSAAAGLALAGAYVTTATPRYEARAVLRIGRPAPFSPAGAGRSTERDASFSPAEVQVLRSRVLAAEVVDSLGLRLQVDRPTSRARGDVLADVRVAPGDDRGGYTLRRAGGGTFAVTEAGTAQVLGTLAVGRPAHFGAVDLTLGAGAEDEEEIRLRIVPSGAAADRVQRAVSVDDAGAGTGVVTLRYRDTDPRLARDVLGAYVARHLGRRREAEAARARSTAANLQAQLDTVTRARVASERAVRAFREREGVVDTKEEASAQVRHVVDLQAQRVAMEEERRALAALLAGVQGGRGSAADYHRLLAYPTLLRTPAATELLRQLGEVDAQRAALSRPTAGAPDALTLAARERGIEGQVQALVRTYLAGLRQQVASIDRRVARASAELARIPGREAELARLQRAPEALGQLETVLQKRIEEARLTQAAAGPGVEVVDPAAASARPVSPRPGPNLGLGLLAGLMAGCGLAVARDRRDHSVRSRGDLRVAAGLPVLAAVPVIRAAGVGAAPGSGSDGLRAGVLRLVRGDDARPASASPSDVMGEIIDTADPVLDDAYARLYLNVLQRTDGQARSLLVASPLPAEGRTTTSLGLATTLARRGLRVLLVDGDLRRGTLAQDYFGLSPNATGLAELLRGTVKLKSALRVVRLDERTSLTYMASGRGAERVAVVLDASAMRTLLTQATALFEAVVIDSPPLNLVTDGALLATLADAVVLVGRTGVTDTAALGEAAQLLRGLGARVVGTLLNGVDPRRDPATRRTREYHQLAAAQRLRTLADGAGAEAEANAEPREAGGVDHEPRGVPGPDVAAEHRTDGVEREVPRPAHRDGETEPGAADRTDSATHDTAARHAGRSAVDAGVLPAHPDADADPSGAARRSR